MTQARQLDAAFLAGVRAWAHEDTLGFADEATFDRHALALFAYQIEHNEPYAKFAALCGFNRARLPASWAQIPAVPAAAFKDVKLATFDVREAELEFHTSGTTAAQSGKHYIERAALYDAALLAGFDHFMLADRMRLRYLNLVPNPRLKTHSSLGYMMGHVSVLRGDGKAAWFLDDERLLDVDGFAEAMRAAIADAQPVCIAGTALAFLSLLEALDGRHCSLLAPPGSRIMETGGFKGRSRAVSRDELYGRLESRLGIPGNEIVAEYGMTELTSQYYDAPTSRNANIRVKSAPPWLRTLVVAGDGRQTRDGETGFLRHFDLGNRSSILAIDTEDRGYAVAGGIVLLGRDADAGTRGCSLTAEDVRAG